MKHRSSKHEKFISIMPELKDSCDPPKFHICECKTSLFVFCLGFTARQDYITHFEPSQSLGLQRGENEQSPRKTA